jgi:hypothetical protein
MNYYNNFLTEHNIIDNSFSKDSKILIECINRANDIGFTYLSEIDNQTDQDGFIVLNHINILGRIYEHVEAMLVCISTKCPTSAEAIGRIVVEGSINLMYMSVKGNEKTILAYYKSWTNEHRKRLSAWKDKIKDKDYASVVIPMINKREKLLSLYELYTNNTIKKFDADVSVFNKIWPKSLFDRFKALEKEELYFEMYHRLSGSSHITAEDTLSWIIALNFPDDEKMKLSKEAWSYSIMMVRLACLTYLDAIAVCCISHGKKIEELDEIVEMKNKVGILVNEIKEAAGVPII